MTIKAIPFVLLALSFQATAAMITPESIDFTQSQFTDSIGNTVRVYKDKKTDWQVKITDRHPLGLTDSSPNQIIEIFDDHFKPIERTDRGNLLLIRETWWPKRTKTEIRSIGNLKFDKITYQWNIKSEKWDFFKKESLPIATFSEGCNPPLPLDELDRKIQFNESFFQNIANETAIGNSNIKIGPNVRAINCEKYKKRGALDLAADFETAVNHGLRCLAELGSFYPPAEDKGARYLLSKTPAREELIKYYRTTAAMILGLLEPSEGGQEFTITCDKAGKYETPKTSKLFLNDGSRAIALLCGKDSGAPGLLLHLYAVNSRNEIDNAATFFHELMHQTHLLHYIESSGKVYDAIYGAEFCCFDTKKTKNKTDIKMDSFSCAELVTQFHGWPRNF